MTGRLTINCESLVFWLGLTQLPLIRNPFTLIYILPISFLQVCWLWPFFFPESSLCPEVLPVLSCLALGRSAFSYTSHGSPFSHSVQTSHSRKMNLRARALLSLAVICVPPNPCSQGLSDSQLCSKHIWQVGNPRNKKVKKDFCHSMLWLFCLLLVACCILFVN